MRKAILFLLFIFLASAVANAQQQVVLYPTDDAYVAADLADPQDVRGLRTLNTGDLPIMEVGYTYVARIVGNVTAGNATLVPLTLTVSFGMLKFDLSNITANEVLSAKLELTARNASLTGYSREVVLYRGRSNSWEELTVNFNNSPGYFNDSYVGGTYIANMRMKTYYWDVTQWVKESAGSQLTLYVAFKTLRLNNTEWAYFLTKESPQYRPRLIIEVAGGGGQPQQGGGGGGQSASPDTTILIAAVAIIVAAAVVAFALLKFRSSKPAKKKAPAKKKRKAAKKKEE